MKNPLQNLLISCALGLCALCAWQWHVQVGQHREMATLDQTIANQTADIQRATNSLAVLDLQLAQLDAHLRELRNTVQSNDVELITLRAETNRLSAVLVQTQADAETKIQQANASIRQQNDLLKILVGQRDDYLKRLNEAIQEHNEVVTKYNDLVKRVEESQAAPAKSESSKKK